MSKTIVEELQKLSNLYGLRGCCKKNMCMHLKAKLAIDRITELEQALFDVCKSIECYQFTVEPIKPERDWDEYDYMMAPLWKKAYQVLNNVKQDIIRIGITSGMRGIFPVMYNNEDGPIQTGYICKDNNECIKAAINWAKDEFGDRWEIHCDYKLSDINKEG